jgi:hypothetical protein
VKKGEGRKKMKEKKMTKKICPQLSFIFVGEHPSKEMETNERQWDSCGRHRVYLVPTGALGVAGLAK